MPKTSITIYEHDRGKASELYAMEAADRFCALFSLTPPAGIVRDPGGKPFFDGGNLFLSISHSAPYIAVAISEVQVGIDIQRHKKCDQVSVARRFFHPDERDFVARNPGCFFDVWAAKESYVKYTGEGIISAFRSFSVVDGEELSDSVGAVVLSQLSFRSGYSLSLAAKNSTIIALSEEF